MRIRLPHALLLGFVTLVGVGCGSAARVTYVDPNSDAAYAGLGGASSSAPVEEFGVDALHRSKAVIAIRSALAAARTLKDTAPAAAADVLDVAVDVELPRIEGRLAASNPALRVRLRDQLEALRAATGGGSASYSVLSQRIAGGLLDQVTAAVVPVEALQDPGFRASVLVETVNDAGIRYEEAYAGGDEIELERSYRMAYGLLLDARTRGLDAVPQEQRSKLQGELTRVANRSMPGPTPPTRSRDADDVLSDLTDIADLIAAAAGIDVTWPPPADGTPDQLRQVKRAVAAAAEAWERDESTNARSRLTSAQQLVQGGAGAGVAAVDPDLSSAIELAITVTIPDAMTQQADVAGAAAELDVQLDDAIGLVETELEQLREAG
ncbi:MAG: hypothetical protein JWM25_1811 [Thermoleophilia bacterium]|nr:hypothetical protein [Thermoleophilia bacterium]MCZ4497226.1 hypothetical protein [Thermoleophilia bacterium]